jgi:prevent-host-death family protein
MGVLENLANIDSFWSKKMPKVSSTDLSNRLGQYQDEALKRPIIITKNNRDRLVMMSIEEYRRLKQLDRKALFVEELTDADLEAISRAEVSNEYDHLNVEYEG